MQETPVQIGEYSFTVVIEPNDPDGYLVTCPALPGLVTEGDTLDEAYSMAQDAIQIYLESLISHGEQIPQDRIVMPVRVRIDNEKSCRVICPERMLLLL
jgi:predicted RNase H-like HicB family nuclease